MKTIRIGTGSGELETWQANQAKKTLEAHGISAEVVAFPPAKGGFAFGNAPVPRTDGFLEQALRFGEVDITLHHLCSLPTTPPDGLVLAGLGPRLDPSECLLLRQGELADHQMFHLKHGATVVVGTALRKVQLLGYRPDLQLLDPDGDLPTLLEKLRSARFDSLLLASAELHPLPAPLLVGFEKVPLNVREFAPAPGQGAVAYRCCTTDLETRRTVQRYLHQPATSATTNVERRALRLLGGDPLLLLGVHCMRDTNGYYHASAAFAHDPAGPVRRARVSQSTHFGLAEKLVAGVSF